MSERFGRSFTPEKQTHGLRQLNYLLTDGLPHAKRDEPLFNRTLLDIFHCDNFLELADRLAPYTVTITIAGGSASRMAASQGTPDAAAIVAKYRVDVNEPRACVHVDNVTDAYLPVLTNQSTVPNGILSLMAMRTPHNKPIGKHIVITAPGEREFFESQIVNPLGIPNDEILFTEQKRFLNQEGEMKPLGHGDALIQLLNDPELAHLLQTHPLWIVNFAGDVPSPIRTIQSAASLFALRGLPNSTDDVSEIIPVVEQTHPTYPIHLGRHNIPLGTEQKRNGVPAPKNGRKSKWMNCGVRAMWGPDTLHMLESLRHCHEARDYTHINPTGKNEFPIDLLDQEWMRQQKTRLMGLSDPEEIHAVKKVTDIPGFGAKARKVLKESKELYEQQPLKPLADQKHTGRLIDIGGRPIFNREGVLRHLPHMIKMEGLSIEKARVTREWHYLSDLFGPELMEEIAEKIIGKNAVVASEWYGYGHWNQLHALLTSLSHIGMTGYGVLASDLSTQRERMATRMKQEMLRLIHHKKGMAEVAQLIEGRSPVELIEEVRTVLMLLMSESYMRSAGIDFLEHKNKFLDPFTRTLSRMLQGHDDLAFQLFQQFVQTDTKYIDGPLRDGLMSFANTVDAQFMFHTHSASARAMVGTPWETKGIYAFPDPGFAGRDLSLALIVLSKIMPYIIPNSFEVRKTLQGYGISVENIYSVGTLTEPIDIETAEKKWDPVQTPKRRILIPLSGSGNGIPYMKQALEDYVQYIKEHSDNSPYELVLYMGHHNNGDTKEVRLLIEQLGLSQDLNIYVAQAHNMAEAARMKWEEKKKAHVEICKGGESAIDTQATATIHLALAGAGPNEDRNVAFALTRYGSSIPSAWPPRMRDYWRNNKLFGDKIAYLPHHELFEEGAPSNLFEMLDIQWKDAKHIGLHGFQLADTMAGITALALALAPLTGDLRFDIHGPLGKQASERIKKWAEDCTETEQIRKRELMKDIV